MKKANNFLVVFLTLLTITLSYYLLATKETTVTESTYVLEVTPAQDYSEKDNKISFIDKQGNKWDYTKNNNICYYSGDEHLLVMADNATPDNIRDDKIISIY